MLNAVRAGDPCPECKWPLVEDDDGVYCERCDEAEPGSPA